MQGLGDSVHVGICTQFFKGMQFSGIQKTSTACKDLSSFLNNDENEV